MLVTYETYCMLEMKCACDKFEAISIDYILHFILISLRKSWFRHKIELLYLQAFVKSYY